MRSLVELGAAWRKEGKRLEDEDSAVREAAERERDAIRREAALRSRDIEEASARQEAQAIAREQAERRAEAKRRQAREAELRARYAEIEPQVALGPRRTPDPEAQAVLRREIVDMYREMAGLRGEKVTYSLMARKSWRRYGVSGKAGRPILKNALRETGSARPAKCARFALRPGIEARTSRRSCPASRRNVGARPSKPTPTGTSLRPRYARNTGTNRAASRMAPGSWRGMMVHGVHPGRLQASPSRSLGMTRWTSTRRPGPVMRHRPARIPMRQPSGGSGPEARPVTAEDEKPDRSRRRR